ncbi:RND family efflux transporter, MFP subunit [Rhodoblastus acidophilus]|uniref:RND family efflux transporter, MFP subunit n=1 Tax=Rhodoblastus acidophilus TaxID=1074 RepID=A0A212QLK9_RHOAC|nr:efflux RND transporter periplasmic adaptor subunit [Rhodoblastus acidophilus]PPQ39827.1 efflux RND transporter periplasmic adaptor subunit [Rhodoblastus acidophilus]RAI23803.1 efflux RND transporter periplasmic adaptor subunit [Rhodoblastus acidophilus]SNB60280.1 RND family efflux transporter, MFP subunit [Rhodoblastus acidophilus]
MTQLGSPKICWLPLLLISALPAGAGEFTVAEQQVANMKAIFGQAESREIAPARTRIGGTIVKRFVDEGAQVKAGDVIAVVADQKLALQAQSLDGQISALISQVDNANVALQRAEDLMKKGFATKAAYDQAKTNADVLAHQLESMKAQRAVIAQQTREGEVLAPKDGRLLTIGVVPGAVVQPGEPIARVASGALYLRLSLPERHAPLLQLGAPVTVAPRVAGGPSREGKIVRIYPELDNGRVIADAEVENIDNYFVGERVRIYAPVGERKAMIAPRDAVTTRSGVDYVKLARAEGPLDVAVVFTDTADPGKIEILSGLKAGDRIVTP